MGKKQIDDDGSSTDFDDWSEAERIVAFDEHPVPPFLLGGLKGPDVNGMNLASKFDSEQTSEIVDTGMATALAPAAADLAPYPSSPKATTTTMTTANPLSPVPTLTSSTIVPQPQSSTRERNIRLLKLNDSVLWEIVYYYAQKQAGPTAISPIPYTLAKEKKFNKKVLSVDSLANLARDFGLLPVFCR